MASARAPAEDDPVRDEAFRKQLVGLIPHLRAFARTLCGDPTGADDLAQDAMLSGKMGACGMHLNKAMHDAGLAK